MLIIQSTFHTRYSCTCAYRMFRILSLGQEWNWNKSISVHVEITVLFENFSSRIKHKYIFEIFFGLWASRIHSSSGKKFISPKGHCSETSNSVRGELRFFSWWATDVKIAMMINRMKSHGFFNLRFHNVFSIFLWISIRFLSFSSILHCDQNWLFYAKSPKYFHFQRGKKWKCIWKTFFQF